MLKQKEFSAIITGFRNNNMKGYEEWFSANVNCEVHDKTINAWRKGVQLCSKSKNHFIIVIEGFNGMSMRVSPEIVRPIENK